MLVLIQCFVRLQFKHLGLVICGGGSTKCPVALSSEPATSKVSYSPWDVEPDILIPGETTQKESGGNPQVGISKMWQVEGWVPERVRQMLHQ